MSPRWEPNPNIRRGHTVIHTLHAHLVFTPKCRRGPFTDEILTRCEEIMRAVRADFETELVEFNGERDHVHLLVHYPPKVAISRLVGSLKGVSARRLRQEFPGHIRKYPFVGAELPTGAPVTPHEVARTVVFLLSDWATGVSGAHLPVDRAQNAPSPDGY